MPLFQKAISTACSENSNTTAGSKLSRRARGETSLAPEARPTSEELMARETTSLSEGKILEREKLVAQAVIEGSEMTWVCSSLSP